MILRGSGPVLPRNPLFYAFPGGGGGGGAGGGGGWTPCPHSGSAHVRCQGGVYTYDLHVHVLLGHFSSNLLGAPDFPGQIFGSFWNLNTHF